MPESYEDLARSALLEITPVATIGSFVSQTPEDDGSVTVRFASAQPGYPDWLWTVSVADVEGGEPTVLEAELLPGEGSLLAPDWLPWSDRLAEYKAAQEALPQQGPAPCRADRSHDIFHRALADPDRAQAHDTLLKAGAVGQGEAPLAERIGLGERAIALQLLGEVLRDLHVGRAGIDDEVRRRTAVDGGRQNEHAAHSLELLRRPRECCVLERFLAGLTRRRIATTRRPARRRRPFTGAVAIVGSRQQLRIGVALLAGTDRLDRRRRGIAAERVAHLPLRDELRHFLWLRV